MARIKQLPSEVAAMIAAGEVVDRPASVIKELVENAIDAGAKHIVAEIRQGGVKLIRVTDDGCGIAEEDVPVAFCRHATSKISVGEDLENIVTLGFRGEALYSIAAVAEVELVTKEAEQEIGVRAIVRAGEIEDIVPAGCPQGTTVMVRDLFFNTPARMKFLKRDATEAGYVEDTLRKIALGRPDISFRLIHNQKEIFFTPGDGCLQNAVAAFYGRDFADAMLPVSYKEDGVEVQGLIGKSELTRPNRTFQTFFVNGRCVMHKSFYVALAEAYKGQIMAGRFPVAVLSLHIHPGFCDVNVHPAKLEIKFAEDKPIFDAIYWGAKNSLYAIRDTRQLKVEPENKPEIMENRIPKAVSAKPAVRVPLYAENPCPIKEAAQTPLVENKPRIAKQTASIPLTEENTWTKKPVCEESQTEKAVYSVATAPEPIQPFIPMPQAFDHKIVTRTAPKMETQTAVTEEENVRVVGQAFGTYIIAQQGDRLLMIDQHAAHERIIYNRMMKELEEKRIDSQMLLLPITVRLSGTEMALFHEKEEVFREIGFDAEEFGSNLVKISMVPTPLTDCNIEAAFVEILDRIAASKKDLRTSAQSYALYGVACKAALKAGKTLSVKEQETLVLQALALEGIATCPHGRPIILSLTQKQIEKQFKRIV